MLCVRSWHRATHTSHAGRVRAQRRMLPWLSLAWLGLLHLECDAARNRKRRVLDRVVSRAFCRLSTSQLRGCNVVQRVCVCEVKTGRHFLAYRHTAWVCPRTTRAGRSPSRSLCASQTQRRKDVTGEVFPAVLCAVEVWIPLARARCDDVHTLNPHHQILS